jgi:hypothetical protein
MSHLRHTNVLGIVAAFGLAGCASAPNQQETANADYGRAMSPAECKTLAEQTISSKLKDPSSAQFRNEQPCFKGWMSSVPVLGIKAAFGYLQKGEVNGKNSFGGYVGFRPYMVLMKDGLVVRSCITDADGICLPDGQ